MRNHAAERVYLILSFCSTFFWEIAFVVQTIFYVTVVGMNPLQLVLAGTVMEVAGFIFEVPTGVVADTWSRRWSVIISMFITGIGFLLQGLVPTVWMVMAGSALFGFGATFSSGALEAWVADEVGDDRLSPLLVRSGQARRAAALLGIGVGSLLGAVSLQIPVIVGSSLVIALGIYLIGAMPERNFRPATRVERSTWQAMGQTLRDGIGVVRGSSVLLTLLLLSSLAGASGEGFARLNEAHLLENIPFPAAAQLSPVIWIGLIHAGGQIVSIAIIALARRRLESIDPAHAPRILLITNSCVAAALLVFAVASNFWLALAMLWLMAVAHAIGWPLYDAWLASIVPSPMRATVFSMLSQGNALGQATGGPLIGAIGTAFRLRLAMVAAALFLLPGSALYARLARQSPEPHASPGRTPDRR